MAKIVWSGAQDANWFNPNNWNPAIVPTAGVTVVIPAGLANYPVVPDGANVAIAQNLTLAGTLTLDSGQDGVHFDNTDLIVNGGVTRTLSGGGSIVLSDSGANRIYSNQGGTVLENVDDTIAGAGQIFANGGNLSIVNDAAGVINASATNNQLNISSIYVTNKGLVEATGAAGLTLNAMTLDQSAGTGVLSANGGNVYLNNMTILGGTLQTPSGLIETAGNSSILDGRGAHPVTIAAGSTVQVNDGQNLALLGTIVNNGAIKLASGQDGVHFDNTDLIFNGSITDKLQGGGSIILSDSGANRIYSNNGSTVLENVDDTITGAGQIFANGGNLSIVNDAAGVIIASAANNQLSINGIYLTNNGIVESTGAAGLSLSAMTLDQSTGAGVLSANGGNVYLNNMTIDGGTLKTSGGLIETSGNSSILDGRTTHPITIAAGGVVQDNDGLNLSLLGVINNDGVIQLASGQDGVHFDNTDLIFNGSITDMLQGGGVLQMSDSAANRIYSNQGSTVLENVNNTITGAGQIYANSGNLSVLNDAAGVINASATNNQLSINSIHLTNNGLVEATGAAGLTLAAMTVDQSTGAGVLSANGGNVYLNNMTIDGGTLQTPSGLIETSGNSSVLDGRGAHPVTIAAGSTVQDSDGLNLTLLGALNLKGALKLASGQDGVHFDNTDLIVNGSINDKLQGGGVLQLSDSGANRIYSNQGSTVLENVDDTIAGAGQIYANSGNLSLLNDAAGVINANAAGNQLNINGIYFANNGLVESTGAAGLTLSAMTLDQSTGTGVLSANGGNIYLNNMTIDGGTLQTPSGLIETSGNGSVLNGTGTHPIAIAAGATVQVNDGLNLSLLGVINIKGSIKLASGQDGVHFDNTDLLAAGGITDKLQGGGSVLLSDSASNRILSNNGGSVLENVDDTISGAGQIFSNGGNLKLQNDAGGVINANAAHNQLDIYSITVANAGLIESTSTGGLLLNAMTLNNAGGTLSAAGGIVNLNGAAVTGGTLTSSGAGRVQTSGNGSLLTTLSVAAGASVWVSDGTNLSIAGTITNAGTISLRSGQDGVHFDNTDLLIQGGGTVTLTGGGSVQLVTGGANRIFSNQGGTTLDNINNKIFGSGVIFANSGLSVINEAAGAITASNTGQTLALTSIGVTNKGAISATSDAILTLNGMTLTQSGAGTLSATQGAVLFNGSHIVGGALASGGSYVIATNGNNTLLDGGSGALSITAGSTVRVSDGTNLSLTGAIANSGTLFLDSGQDGVHFDNTDLLIQGAVNLTGGGTVLLSNSASNRIYTNNGGSVLTNTSDTIVGAGQIFSNSGLSIVNGAAGTIEAGQGETLTVSTSIANSGVLEGNGGALVVLGTVTGAGTVEVANGGSVSFGAASAIANVVYAGPQAGTIQMLTAGTPTFTGFAAGDVFYAYFAQNVTSLGFVENAGNASGVLTFYSGGAAVANYTLNGFYTNADFQLVGGSIPPNGPGYYGVLGVGDVWGGGTAAWSAGPWSQGLPGADDDVVINAGQPTVAAGIGAIRSLSVIGAGAVDFGGVGGNTVSGAVYDAASLGLDGNAGEGGASLAAGALTVAAGGKLTLGNASLSASDQLSAGSLLNNGQITLTGAGTNQALLNVAGAAGFGAAGTVSGKVALAGDSAIKFATGGLQTVAAGSSLSLAGPSAFVELVGALGANSALTGLRSIAGALSLESGAVIAPTGALYDSGAFNVDDVGAGGTTLTLPTLYVTGALTIGNAGMTVADAVNVTTLHSLGAITLAGGASAQALLNVNAAAGTDAPVGRLFGSLSLSGHSALQFASGALNAIDASGSLRLQGANAFVQIKTAPNADSALTMLATNAGVLSLENGASFTDNAALTNSGAVSLDALPGEGGSSLTEAIGFTNTGTLTVGNATLSAATTLNLHALTNTATINVTGAGARQALISVAASAGFGTAGVLTGAVTLAGNAQIKFGSGGITTIAGGASLDLVGSAALLQNNVAGVNTGLKTLASVAGTLTLDSQVSLSTTSALADSGVVLIDATGGEGGSNLTTSGALTIGGRLTLGNGALSSSDLVKAAALNVTGGLTLIGGATTQALLSVGSAAGFGSAGVLTGTVTLAGDSAISFASGAIVTVAGGANLTITGGSAFIEDATSNSNSALSTLSADSGAIALHNAVNVVSSRALTVSPGASFTVDAAAGEGGSHLSFAGALSNSGTLTLGNATLSQNDSIQATSLANTATIALVGGATTQALLNITHAAGFGAGTVLTGAVSLTNDSAIEFSGGSLTGIAAGASLTLDGPNAYIEAGASNADNALSSLNSVAGVFNLLNGGTVSTVALTNSGQMQLAATRGSGLNTSLTVGGVLKNTGGLSLLGSATAQANVTVTATGISNTGALSLVNGATGSQTLLNVSGAAGFGTGASVTGAVTIGANSAISFGSGAITSIGKGASLELAANNAYLEVGASNSNSALAKLATNNGTLQIDYGSVVTTTNALTNAGVVSIDAATGGGGALNIGGGFFNNGAVTLGAGLNLAANAEITATSLTNTGSLTLAGGASTQALMQIGGAAGFGTAGVFKGQATLINDAQIAFASGGISTIASGSTLHLAGSQAEVSAGGANALSSLATLAGVLDLDNGAGFSDSATLSISGGLFLDSVGGEGGSSVADSNAINNSGTLNLGNASSGAGSSVTTATLGNTGFINLTGNGSNHFAELDATASFVNNGAVFAISDHESISGAVSGTGTFDLWNGSTLSFAGAVGTGQTVTFDTPGTLGVNAAGNVFQAAIAAFGAGDSINVSNFAGAGASLSYQDNGNHTGVLTVTNGGNSTLLNFAGDYTTANFSVNGNTTTATIGFV